VAPYVLLATLLVQIAVATIHVRVTAGGQAVGDAQVIVNGETRRTGTDGALTLAMPPGVVEITIVKEGFNPQTIRVTATIDREQTVEVVLEAQTAVEEHVTVSATRTDTRLEDQPMRVEVLGAEEIEEKQLMTPGDIVMMLNEMGGLRVQATSPSLGAASVRVQGMRGRYTRFLSDGLPLYGQDVGGLGLLQIPPSDLGQVEVIKGVASALYGAGALGGVVDLISRRPGEKPSADVVINRTTLGGTDAVLFGSRRVNEHWSASLLASGHWQEKTDVDDDGWADLAGYSRGVVRPRIFWNGAAGQSLFATTGVTWERRRGGTIDGAVLAATRAPFVESLDTMRVDAGVVAQALVMKRYVLTARSSFTRRQQDHTLGDTVERNEQDTIFSEVALRGTAPRQTWVIGTAFERATLDPRARPDLAFSYSVPGVFAQDDVRLHEWLSVSVSGRVDVHSQFGTFVSPRASALVRRGGWSGRVSVGSGFFAPTALTEETEAAGLLKLRVPVALRAEKGRSTSFDVTRTYGPVTVSGTLFRYDLRDPAVVDRAAYTLSNLDEPTTNAGVEGVVTFRKMPFSLTGTYTFVDSTEGVGADRGDIPLTPRHSAGIVGMWAREGRGRIGVEAYFTGRQRLEDNPYRSASVPYVLFGGLIEKRVGRVRVFVNAENLGNVRQSHTDPLVRPFAAADGRWTVDAWAPLDGRVVNGGIRVTF
jgi:outer membrane receptor for ferrienterochelin and colicins